MIDDEQSTIMVRFPNRWERDTKPVGFRNIADATKRKPATAVATCAIMLQASHRAIHLKVRHARAAVAAPRAPGAAGFRAGPLFPRATDFGVNVVRLDHFPHFGGERGGGKRFLQERDFLLQ